MAIIHIQPAMPHYRIDFFRRLFKQYGDSLKVFYSPREMDPITVRRELEPWEHPIGPTFNLLKRIQWQSGAISVPIKRNDTVVVSGNPRNLTVLLVLMRARLIGAKTIWWGHYWSATSKVHRHRFRVMLAKLASAILFYADSEVDDFYKDGWTHNGPVSALNNGIDISKICHLRRSFNLSNRGNNILFIGRLTAKARLDLVIEALAKPGLETVYLNVIGDGRRASSLWRQAIDLGVADRIIWYGDISEEARIASVANNCLAFVYGGAVGLSLIHAMAYGIPCIVHDNRSRHMPEIAAFENFRTGVLFRYGDSQSLAEALVDHLSNTGSHLRMAKRCSEVVDNFYNTESMAIRFVRLQGTLKAG